MNDLDVKVVGAGVTGLTLALLLRDRGINAAVTGARNDAEPQFVSGFVRARRAHGDDAARSLGDAAKSSADTAEKITRRFSIECGFRRGVAYLYTERRNKVADLKNEANAARECGVAATWVPDVPLPFTTRGAVRFDDQPLFNAGAYVDGLAPHVPRANDDQTARVVILCDARDVEASQFAHDGLEGMFQDTADPPHTIHALPGRVVVAAGDDLFIRERFGEITAPQRTCIEGGLRVRRIDERTWMVSGGVAAALLAAKNLAEREGFEPSVEL